MQALRERLAPAARNFWHSCLLQRRVEHWLECRRRGLLLVAMLERQNAFR